MESFFANQFQIIIFLQNLIKITSTVFLYKTVLSMVRSPGIALNYKLLDWFQTLNMGPKETDLNDKIFA